MRTLTSRHDATAWTDDQLRAAIRKARSWRNLMNIMGFPGQSSGIRQALQTRATELGLSTTHFSNNQHSRHPDDRVPMPQIDAPEPDCLRDAAETIAIAWFMLRNYDVEVPQRATAHDFVVRKRDLVKKVQVKSTTHRDDGEWLVNIGRRTSSASKNVSRDPYTNGLVDWFFVIDGDMAVYIIPAKEVTGQVTLRLTHYQDYRAGAAVSLAAQI